MSSALSQYWTLLTEYDRTIIVDCPERLKCDICHKLIIDAHQSRCICKFCRKCIEHHVMSRPGPCPGNGKHCKNNVIKSMQDVNEHYEMNQDVLLLKSRCPNESCTFDKELEELPKHLLTCSKKPVTCPFSRIGCSQNKLSKDSINEHLHSSVLDHSTKTIDFLKRVDEKATNLNNEYERNKMPQTIMGNSLKSATERLQKQSVQIQGLEEKLGEAHSEIVKLKSNVETLSTDLKTAMSEMEKISSIFIDYQRKTEKHLTQIREQDKRTQDAFIKSSEDQQRDMNNLKLELSNIVKLKNEVGSKLKDFRTQSLLIDHQLTIQNYGEFIWKIDHFSLKKKEAQAGLNEEIYSSAFYTHKNGYKMRLKIFPNGILDAKGKYLGLYFYVQKGEYDDILPWPLLETISLSILDQDTKKKYVGIDYSYEKTPEQDKHVFQRPEMGDIGFGTVNLVEMNDLMNKQHSVLKNDTIFVQCVLRSTCDL